MSLLSVRQIHKSFRQGGRELEILRGLSFELAEGDDVCIVGASGAGKSTFLHIIGTLERPTAGQIFYRDENLQDKKDDELALFRNRKLGFVFQFHYLMSEFTALENVMMPLRIGGVSAREANSRAEKLLDLMGLKPRLHHYPSELSGGEQQRVAIARALVCGPEILLADEPTGNLDSHNAKLIQDLFFTVKKELGLTMVAVTHDLAFASRFSRQLRMADGLWVTTESGW